MAWATASMAAASAEPAVCLLRAGGFGGCDARFGLGKKFFHVEAARGAFLRGGFGVGLFIGLVFQRCEQAAHANAGGAQVGDLVDLKHGVNFAGAFQNLLAPGRW